jgi:hypothetical protein
MRIALESIAGMLVMLNISSAIPAQQSGIKPILVSAVLPAQSLNVSSIRDLLQNAQLYMGTTVALRGMVITVGKRSFSIVDDTANTLWVYLPPSSHDANTLVSKGQRVTVTGQVRRMPEQANEVGPDLGGNPELLGRPILVLENVRPNTTQSP